MEKLNNYKKIIRGLEMLIEKIDARLESYKDDNMHFAELIYEEGFEASLAPGGMFSEYGEYVKANIDRLEGKLHYLKKIKEDLEIRNLLLLHPHRMN